MSLAGTALVYLLVAAATGAVVAAWTYADTLDAYPWYLLLGLGAAVAAAAWRWSPACGERARELLGWLLFATPAWFLAAGLFANAWLDRSPPQRHASEVLRVLGNSRGAATIVVRDFRDGGELQRTDALFAAHRPGQRLTIVTRPGLFGWTRIEAVETAP
ncbi:hypothetical protein [Nannocystis punicea]|uniref:SH3 domain-containing protein n=1 Tax=Nannocystis punicea TaxID=2995304 RepID=A0ABY7GUS7_9BACT|nr:hypothetical protein [Nannocystis poenicansa]WAS90718.1 hypothetical protein O0S08_31410 [Nannocystis poenicansa]